MAKIFISFRGEDEFKVFTLRGLAEFKNVTFERMMYPYEKL